MISRAWAIIAFPFMGGMVMGCQPAPSMHYDVYLTPSLSIEMMETVVDATQEWVKMSNGGLTVSVTVGEPMVMLEHQIIIHGDHTSRIQEICESTHALGCTRRRNDLDSANVWLSYEVQVGIGNAICTTGAKAARHEFGHALGLSHSVEQTIMFHSTQHQPDHVTCADIRQYSDIRHRWSNCEAKLDSHSISNP